MKRFGAKAGIRSSKAAVVQPEGSSYAGKAAAQKPEISVEAAANQLRISSSNQSGKIVCDTYDCNPFRADKELSRKIR